MAVFYKEVQIADNYINMINKFWLDSRANILMNFEIALKIFLVFCIKNMHEEEF